jgi:carboxyl-terminal processing protease
MKSSAKKYSVIGLISVFSISFWAFAPQEKYFEIAKNLDIFATLYKEVNNFYVEDVSPNQLMKTGIDAMLKSLDPYTNFIPEDEIEDYRTATTGQYGGIGAQISKRNKKTIIAMPYEGYPAHKAGLKIGDEIISIDGIDITEKSSAEVSKLLKGQAGTKVDLLVKRFGQKNPLQVTLQREKIKVENVTYHGMVAEEVGYLQLREFTNNASVDVQKAIEELKKQGAKKLIFDLRGNPGGLLSEAINISNLFVPKDQEIVSTKGKVTEWNKTYKALNAPYDLEIPLIVLIDNKSASASEIVSGVMQDYDRGVLIGQKSFGKGLVQATRPLSYNSQLKITTARYYIPSGRCIQAIDYAQRDRDGKAKKLPDSLRVAFKTKAGRTVYDGAGISPDLETEPYSYKPITNSLIAKNLLFDYAVEYATNRKEIPAPEQFQLSEQEYETFIKWLQGKDYDYTTQVEKSLEDLVSYAKKENYYVGLENEITKLQKELSHNKENDLRTNKQEIKTLLEREIIAHYYFEKGATKAALKEDTDVKAALELFNNMEKYNAILKK